MPNAMTTVQPTNGQLKNKQSQTKMTNENDEIFYTFSFNNSNQATT